jgi:hypothetical protein
MPSHKNKKQQNKKPGTQQKTIVVPDSFRTVIADFARDLMTSFPEHTPVLAKWSVAADIPEPVLVEVFEYMLTVYPERFFDILYQNEDMFKPESGMNVHFFPGLDFRQVFGAEGVSESIRSAVWKYMQLMLMTIVGSVRDKTGFGDAASMFDGVDEADLQKKMSDTIGEIGRFFTGMSAGQTEDGQSPSPNAEGAQRPNEEPNASEGTHMPNADELNDHLKGLFDGKIGSLAKELAEELATEMSDMFGKEDESVKTTQDLLKKMMKNPKKIMDLVKTIGAKLNDKMKSGEISEQEIMKEAGELMSKMKGMGGKNEFTAMFQNIAKGMGMGGSKMNMGAFDTMAKKYATKERLAAKLEQNRAKKETDSVFDGAVFDGNKFSVDGEDKQQTSSIRRPMPPPNEDIDALAREIEALNAPSTSNKKRANKKNKHSAAATA